MSAGRPQSILFACTYNRTRSPMAESLAKLELGDGVRVASCGTHPRDEADYFMLSALQEIGAHRPDRPGQGFEIADAEPFDLIISMTDESRAEAERVAKAHGAQTEHWDTADPTATEGSRDQVLEAYRTVRDDLRGRIRQRFAG
jgi:protein-tyrosine-phosphatase